MYGHWETGKAGCGRGRPSQKTCLFGRKCIAVTSDGRCAGCVLTGEKRGCRLNAGPVRWESTRTRRFFVIRRRPEERRKNMTNRQKKTGAPDGVRRAFVRRVARGGRDAHNGGLFAPVHVRFVGRARAALPACGILFHQADGRARPPRDHAGRHGGRVYLCDLVAQDPVRDRLMLAHDRHRSGRDPVRAERGVHPGRDRTAVPGHPAGARRPDHAGRKRVFHGGRRAVRVLRHLQAVPAAAGEQNGIGFSSPQRWATCSPTA